MKRYLSYLCDKIKFCIFPFQFFIYRRRYKMKLYLKMRIFLLIFIPKAQVKYNITAVYKFSFLLYPHCVINKFLLPYTFTPTKTSDLLFYLCLIFNVLFGDNYILYFKYNMLLKKKYNIKTMATFIKLSAKVMCVMKFKAVL